MANPNYLDAGLPQIRESVALCFQDFARYQFTAGENIGVGRVANRDDEAAIVAAARQAGIDDVVRGLPDGYGTMLSKEYAGGVDLSGGQWQRIAIARCFFRNAPLVILDEPSAALDARAEEEVFRSLRELCADRAVVFISHRLSTATMADRVIVLEGGQIVEAGTHEDLIERRGTYWRLFSLQAARYGAIAPVGESTG